MRTVLFLLVAIAIALPQSARCEDNVITWYRAKFAPGFITEGPLEGRGYHDVLLNYIKQSLPEYKHVYITAHFGRALQQIRNSNACAPALIRKPERESYVAFSKPTMVGLMNGMHILKRQLGLFKPFIDSKGYICLKTLLKKSNLQMGVSKGRRYGGIVDRIITSGKYDDRIVTRYKDDVFAGLAKQLQAGRQVDFIIGYPQEMRWPVKQGLLKDEFAFIPIKEMPRYIVSQVGCSNNAWGRVVIAKINKLLKGEYYPPYKRRYQEYLAPGAIRFHNEFVKEAFPPNPE